MKIIILGAGQVGSSVAAILSKENNDVTVVDHNHEHLQLLSEHYDLRTILGMASLPSVIGQAGGQDADMIIAVTNSDEVNMIACQIAYTLFRTPTKIARVRNSEYLDHSNIFFQEAIPIDALINPHQLVTHYIEHLIQHPGVLQVLDFANNSAQIVAVRVKENEFLVGRSVRSLKKHIPNIDYYIAIIYRGDNHIIPMKDTVFEVGDEFYFIAATDKVKKILSLIGLKTKTVKRVMIAGGGNIGLRVSMALENKYNVKILESNSKRVQYVAQQVNNAVVLHSDAANEELLINENIEKTDIYCALTNDDEANIVSSMLAKHLGAKKVMTLINRPAYVDLVQSSNIDICISPQQATISKLLAYTRKGDIVVVHSLRKGSSEVIEAVAHGNYSSSKVVQRAIKDIELPPDTTISAIIRDKKLIIIDEDTVIESGDHVILIVADKKYVPKVELLFQVNITFI